MIRRIMTLMQNRVLNCFFVVAVVFIVIFGIYDDIEPNERWFIEKLSSQFDHCVVVIQVVGFTIRSLSADSIKSFIKKVVECTIGRYTCCFLVIKSASCECSRKLKRTVQSTHTHAESRFHSVTDPINQLFRCDLFRTLEDQYVTS